MSPRTWLYHLKWVPTAQHQRDQCQNFSLGHNLCHKNVDCSQISKRWPIQIIHEFGMSPRVSLYILKLVTNSKETSAKISVLVTICVIDLLIAIRLIKSGPSKLSINFPSIWNVTKNRPISFEISA